MAKKAQVTNFVVLGVVIILIIVLVYFISGQRSTKSLLLQSNKVNKDVERLNAFFLDCIELVGEEAVYYVGQHGGYFDLSNNSIFGVPYYLFDGKISMPTRQDIENEISSYMEEALPYCGFDFIENMTFDPNEMDAKFNTNIFDERVLIKTEQQLSIELDGVRYNLNDFETELPIKLGLMHDSANSFVRGNFGNETQMCIGCLLEDLKKKELHGMISFSDDGTIIYTVIDPEYVLRDRYELGLIGFGNYNFKFAIRY